MSVFNINILPTSELINQLDLLNAKRSARLREEGPTVCLDKEYRLLCKSINELREKIHSLSKTQSVKF